MLDINPTSEVTMKFSIFFIIFSLYRISYCARVFREVIPQKYENCPIERLPMKMMIKPLRGINNVTMTGYIEVTEDYSGDLTATIDANKCDLEMKSCINYSLLKVNDMCGIFVNKGTLFASAFKSIKPPLKCPLKKGNHTFVDTVIDLSIFSMIPIDGSIWVANFKLIGGNGKNKKTVMCWGTETKVLKVTMRN